MEINKIILCSQSPRRREFIEHLGFPVVMINPVVDEVYPDDIPLDDIPKYLAELKADSFPFGINEGEVLITCDTVVILDDEIIGKPKDKMHAIETLKRLSGRTHIVVSGVVIKTRDFTETFKVRTEVTFVPLCEPEIIRYVDEHLPLDKAGSYGIQEHIGFIGVESIKGSYMNVIGLPLAQIKSRLCDIEKGNLIT